MATTVTEDREDCVTDTAASLRRVWDWTIVLLALAVIPALLLESRETTPGVQLTAQVINWAVWLAFCADALGRWTGRIGRTHEFPLWVDVGIILLSPPFGVPESWQWLRVARLLRVLRAAAVLTIGLRFGRRALQHRQFHYVALSAATIIVLGALAVYVIERGLGRAIESPGDALWWAVVTATTVGYGDLSPETTEGRVIAVALMLTGIGLIGIFTATIASFFLEPSEGPSGTEARLAALEAKLDLVLARLDASRPGAGNSE